MADGGEQHAARYSAFISYSHRDGAFARRLHRMLETYRLPRRISRNHADRVDRNRRLLPVFRDRDELAAAADLTEAVEEAIAQSGFLIIVCSANAVASAWVAREVALFRRLHGPRAILVALAEGASPDLISAILCGPGEAPGMWPQPLAADFSRNGDGTRLALLKLVAVLAGVRLDELIQRDTQRHMRVISAVSLAALCGMAIMTILAAVAIDARRTAEHERARGESLIDYMLTDLRGGLKAAGRLDLLDKLNQGVSGYFGAQDLSRMDDAGLRQRVKLLLAMGSDDSTRGKMAQARVWFEQAARTTAARLEAQPHDLERIFDQSQSEYWLAFIDWRTGDTARAEAHFRAYAALVDTLVQAEPANTRWLIERGYADSNLAMFLTRHALDLAHAQPLFAASLAALQDAAGRLAYDADLQVQIADGYIWLADGERLRHDFAKALTYRTQARAVLDAVLLRDGRDAEARGAVAINYMGIGRIACDRRAYDEAFRAFDEGRAIAATLVREDPQNMYMREQVRAFDLFRVRAEMAQGLPAKTPDAVLAEIDDCRPERTVFSDKELTAFCAVLRARRLGKAGGVDAASRESGRASGSAGDVLSSRWGLDFAAEKQVALNTQERKTP